MQFGFREGVNFLGWGIDYLIFGRSGLTGELYTKKKCYYFQLKLIPSTYSIFVLSGLDFEGGV
jgi:hypothetical protein